MDLLFTEGHSFVISPIRVIWMKAGDAIDAPAQVMFSVPKKSFKRATDRNFIKRHLREAYRLNKHLLYEPVQANSVQLITAFIYTGKKLSNWKDLQPKIILTLQRLAIEAISAKK